jgi:hypothetical protein
LITVPTTADNHRCGGMDESFSRLFEVVGFLLANVLTTQDVDQNEHLFRCGCSVFRGNFFGP